MRYRILILILVITVTGLFPMVFIQADVDSMLEKELEQASPDKTIQLIVELKPGARKQTPEEIWAKYEPRQKELSDQNDILRSEYGDNLNTWPKEAIEERNRIGAESRALALTARREIMSGAEEANADIKNEFIQWIQSKGGKARSITDILNMVAVTVPVDLVQEIRKYPTVISVELDRHVPIDDKNPLTPIEFKEFLLYVGIAVASLIFIFGLIRILKE